MSFCSTLPMKLLSAAQIRLCDQFTIEQEGIAAHQLMERAAKTCFNWIQNHLLPSSNFTILCGSGNNGGDGLALARLLFEAGHSVKVLLLDYERYSECNHLNQDRLSALGLNIEIASESGIQAIKAGTVIIDALLGTGFLPPLRGDVEALINAASRRMDCFKLSIDLPSGFSGDEPVNNAFKANVTLCFQRPRAQFFFAENEQYTGRWELMDIGLRIPEFVSSDEQFTPHALRNAHYILRKDIKNLITPRNRFAHKGNFGKALLIGGAEGKTGALLLAVQACLRSGAGLTWAFCTEKAEQALHQTAPEAQTIPSEDQAAPSGLINTESFNAVGIGPGCSTSEGTAKLLKLLIQNATQPLVLDADALTILSNNKTWLAFLPNNTLLTPHPGEFDRMTEVHHSSWERFCAAHELSLKTGAYILLKGAYSALCCPDGSVYFNSTGNPGMAKGGSGDVLTGLLTGLLAQGYGVRNAALIGMHLHGLAGDFAAEAMSENGMKAGDLIQFMPEAWKAVSLH